MTDNSEDSKETILKAGKKYSICTCGHSKSIPFCDSSHKNINEKQGTNYKSVKITPEKDITLKVSSKNWK